MYRLNKYPCFLYGGGGGIVDFSGVIESGLLETSVGILDDFFGFSALLIVEAAFGIVLAAGVLGSVL